MTKIEKLTIWPFDQQQVVDNYNKINELIDKVNQQEEQIKALQKKIVIPEILRDERCKKKLMDDLYREWKTILMWVESYWGSCPAITWYKEKDLSWKINEWLDRVYWTTKEQEDAITKCGSDTDVPSKDLLVPDEVEFVQWEDSCIWLLFGDWQVLYLDWDVWYVGNINSWWRKVKCKLSPCKLNDVEVGEWCILKKDGIEFEWNYRLIIDEYKEAISADMSFIDQNTLIYLSKNVEVYKVQPIE